MKAVILAGDEGVRLRPMGMGMPQAMLSLLDRPVMEHTVALLGKHGIRDICVVLHHQPQTVIDHFGDGGQFGVSMTYLTLDVPLGTAGSLSQCIPFVGREDVLVVPGGMVCDLDLMAAMTFHREKNARATMVLCRHPKPLEHRLVFVDSTGRVEQVVGRPGWGQAVTNLVDTGICVLSPAALNRILPHERQDLVRDLFQPMCEEERSALYGCPVDGYWNDLGDCQAYLDCVADALSGKVKLALGLEQRDTGVWSVDPVPEGVTIIPPCWIGPEVQIGSGSLVGPHVAVGKGSQIGTRSLVQRSVLMSARVGDRATLYGAILCPGARAGDETVLNEGTVLGEGALAQDRAVLMERVRLWPGRTAWAGCRLTHSMTAGGKQGPLRFGDGGVIRGTLGEELTAQSMLALGNVLGENGKVAVGCSGGPGALMLARAAASGITAAGGTVLYHDMECAAQSAWLGESYQMPVSLFIEEDGEKVYLHLFDSWGLALGRGRERKIEHALMQGEVPRVAAGQVGSCEHLTVGPEDYARDAARRSAFRRTALRTLRVAVPGTSGADRAMRRALEELGCQVTDQWQRGIPAFFTGHGGLRLTARDETGALLSSQQLLAMVALVEMENGGGRLAVPEAASAAVDLVAAGFGKKVERLGRDGESARQLYRTLPWLRDAAFAAARLCARLMATGERLEQLNGKTPRFASWKREVPLSRDRGIIMQELAIQTERAAMVGEGLRLRSRGGWVYLVPLSRRSALKIVAEGPDLELAAELCDFYAGQVAKLDRRRRKDETK